MFFYFIFRDGSTNYSQRFSRTVTLTSSSHYDHTAGVAIKVGTKFSAGIRVVGEGTTTILSRPIA